MQIANWKMQIAKLLEKIFETSLCLEFCLLAMVPTEAGRQEVKCNLIIVFPY
jgi:hypothetical protein